MINNINIPLNSTLDLASYNTTVPNNEVSFSTKETLKYRNCLSNLREIHKEGLVTTNGSNINIKKGEGLFYDNVNLGIKVNNVSHSFLTDKIDLPANFPGNYYASYFNTEVEAFVIFSEDSSQSYNTYFDKEGNLLKTTVYDKNPEGSTHTFCIPIRSNFTVSEDDVAPARSYHLKIVWEDNKNIKVSLVTLNINEAGQINENETLPAQTDFGTITDVKGTSRPRFTYLGSHRDAMITARGKDYEDPTKMNEAIAIGFDDLDQRKRVTFKFGVITSADGNMSIIKFDWLPYIPYFGTLGVAKDGTPIVTGEPLPIKNENGDRVIINDSSLYPFFEEENGVISWFIEDLSGGHDPWEEYQASDDRYQIVEKGQSHNNSNWLKYNHKRVSKNVIFVNGVNLIDGMCNTSNVFKNNLIREGKYYTATTPYPYDLGNIWEGKVNDYSYNPFPTGTVFTNLTENKGKYWDYGAGWSKYLAFTWTLNLDTAAPLDILTLPLYIIRGEDVNDYTCADPLGNIFDRVYGSHHALIDADDNNAWIKWAPNGYTKGTVLRLHRFDKGETDRVFNAKRWTSFSNTLGGTNAEGWLMKLPFTAATENSNIFTIWYNGLKTAYTTKNTLISTPGDEVDRPLWISVATKETSNIEEKETIRMIDGYSMYTIVKITNRSNVKSTMTDYFKVDKISDFLYRVNILDERNLIKESPSGSYDFISGFFSWAMDSDLYIKDYSLNLPPDGSDTNDNFFYANGINQNKQESMPVASFLFPYIQLPFYLDTSDNLYFNKRCISLKNPFIQPQFDNTALLFKSDSIDVYYNHSGASTTTTYQYTNFMDEEKSKYFDVNKQGFIWETSPGELFFPIGLGSTIKSENFITPTVQLSNDYSVRLFNKNNQTFMIFNNVNRTYRGQAIFTIYGGNYTYDGQGIYYIGSGNDYSQSQFVCYALGLKFLANSGSEAYFYSPWEKRLFLFTGSNTLQAAESYSSLGKVKDSLFSSNEQSLYLLFENPEDDVNDLILIRSPEDSGTLNVPKGGHLESSSDGCVVVLGNETLEHISSIAISPYKGEPVPFNLETEYIGDDSMLYKIAYVDILFLDNNKNLNFDITFDVINGIVRKEETKHIELSSKDWKGTTYRYTFTPANMMGNSFKLGIKSKSDIYISYIGVGLDDMSTNPTAPRTKGK